MIAEQKKTPCYVCGFRMALPASQVQHPCVPCGGKHALCADHLYEFNPSIVVELP